MTMFSVLSLTVCALLGTQAYAQDHAPLRLIQTIPMPNVKGRAAPQAPAHELAPLQLIQKIPVRGVEGRVDHFTAFPKCRLLIFAALGNNSMEVVNTFQAKVVQSVKGLDEPQGVLYVPGLDKIFVANAGSGKVMVYDGKTYALRKTIDLGAESDTDNLRYDEDSKRVFVGIVGGIAMIDAVTETHVGKDLKGSGGHSESFQLEKKGSRIFPDDADQLRYDPVTKRVYVGYGDGAIGLFDAATNKRIESDFELGAHPESF